MNIRRIAVSALMLFSIQLQAREYNILDFGAVKEQLSTSAIQKAVNECALTMVADV